MNEIKKIKFTVRDILKRLFDKSYTFHALILMERTKTHPCTCVTSTSTLSGGRIHSRQILASKEHCISHITGSIQMRFSKSGNSCDFFIINIQLFQNWIQTCYFRAPHRNSFKKLFSRKLFSPRYVCTFSHLLKSLL